MFKVMVVDDELMIRRGLRCAIDWPVWGLQFCGDAANGQEALDLARRQRPEIVITDIRMPLMNGLELAEKLREMLPEVRIVLLSGYEDIGYLKKAMEIGIKDYLLKPAGMDEIIPVVTRLRDEIRRDIDQKNQIESRDSLLEESLPVLQAHLIDNLVAGRQNLQSAAQRAIELHIPLAGPCFRLILAEIGTADFANHDRQPGMSSWLLIRIIQEVLDDDQRNFACRTADGNILILLNEQVDQELPRSACERIIRLAYTQLGLEVSLHVSSPADGIDQLPIAFKQCQRCQAHQPWAEQERLFIWDDLQAQFSGITPDTRASENQIFASINSHSKLNLSLIQKIFAAFQENGASFAELKRRCVRILNVAGYLENGNQLEIDPEERINASQTASHLYKEMEDILQTLNLSVEKTAAAPSIQDKAAAYVFEHYHENLNLELLAEKLFLSPSYLGRVLRTELGMPFHEWLNRYRISRACELLQNRNLRTGEIAIMVGFSSYKYFSQIFAQQVGCGTREYRNRLIGGA